MSFLFRANKTINGRKIMNSANTLYTKLKELDSKLEELEVSISELVTLIQKRKATALFSEYFDIKEGTAPVILIATKDFNPKFKENLNNFQRKYGFTLVVEKNKEEKYSHISFLLSSIYEKLRKDGFWIVVLKPLDDYVFIEDVPHIAFSYPYPTKDAKYQRDNILGLIATLKQNIYVVENDLIGLDSLLYYTVKFFNKKNLNKVIPLVIGINEEISLDKFESVIKHIINWGQDNV